MGINLQHKTKLARRASSMAVFTCLCLLTCAVQAQLVISEDAPKVAPAKAAAADLSAHLDAGEFGPAIELANNTKDKVARQDMMKQIALAQIQAGEYSGALMTVRQGDDAKGADDAADCLLYTSDAADE